MSRRMIGRINLLVLLVGIRGCSDSAAGPDEENAPLGHYDLDFTFDRELVLIATVRQANGDVAQSGSVTFQYCSKGPPRDDITDPDESAMAVCAGGAGSWAYVGIVPIGSGGEARFNFGAVTVVTVIGFRYKYDGAGGGVASFTTAGEDWHRF